MTSNIPRLAACRSVPPPLSSVHVSAFKMKKSPVPLIAPKYSFTGHDWWTPLTITWRKMHALEAFVDSDYLIPTLSKDGLGLIPRPSSPDRALRWLKAALGRRGLRGPQVENLSWHSFRVFIPDCAFQLHIPQDLGRSPPERPLRPTPESTASWEMVDAEKIPADLVADASATCTTPSPQTGRHHQPHMRLCLPSCGIG